MSDFYNRESERCYDFRRCFEPYVTKLHPSPIASTSLRTDGYSDKDGLMELLTEGKLELAGSGGVEPLFQAGSYYFESARVNGPSTRSSLPCFVIYYAGVSLGFSRDRSDDIPHVPGAHFGFAGAAFSDRPHLEPLGPMVPLCHNPHDHDLLKFSAKLFRAAKQTILSIRSYYTHDFPILKQLPFDDLPDPRFPYKTECNSVFNKSLVSIKYVAQLFPDKLVFRCVQRDAENTRLITKFVRTYGKEVHMYLAAKQIAPNLLAYENLPGGWSMVVMEELTNHVGLDTLPRPLVTRMIPDIIDSFKVMHDRGFVHGDIRDCNVMALPDGTKARLIDFDWAGSPGHTRYPLGMNRTSVYRPTTAVGGAFITMEDDEEMATRLLGQ